MATREQNTPAAEGRRDDDLVISQSNNGETAPPLPQRPASIRPQPLPQPFYSQHQQVYVPYNGQPNPQLAYATPVRPLPKQSSAYIATRLGLTALCSVLAIIIIALTSILLSQGTSVASVSLYAYAIVVASIIWNTAELITYCVRLRKQAQRGIHPGAHVGLNLIFWLAGIFAILLTVAIYQSVSYAVQRCAGGDDDDDYSYYYGYYCDEYKPYSYYKWNILPVLRALLAIFALWTINHFVLFVLACIDTHKRNVLKPAAFVMPMPAPNTAPTQAVYYPQQVGTQPQQPMQYYPYPIMVQPQPESQTPVPNEKQPAPVDRSLTGFYAPTSGPSMQPSPNNTSVPSPPQNIQQTQ
ncbi:hypothetical protein ONZ43_g906 [Nemania bipapillata]|uniref:Uncharacterized protein n=1 Tax=Nemania bipapillata TaxID=110536 RepID=A0ACC2J6S2_9PEZI|nr:hypothetical protein ONZ43_g906 [Nemania bipapillata]